MTHSRRKIESARQGGRAVGGARGAYVIHANEARRAVDSPKKTQQSGGHIVVGAEERSRQSHTGHPSEGGLLAKR